MTKIWVAAYDLHYPKYDKKTFLAMLAFIKRYRAKIAGFIFGGDQFDNEVISHHTKGKPLYRVPGGFKRDEDGFKDNILVPLESALGNGPTRVWITGNHERFEQDFIEEHPELQGLVDHVSGLQLRESGWTVVPLGYSYKVGKLTVVHGEVLTGIGNQATAFPAKKAMEIYGTNVLAGHTHAAQSFTRVSPVDEREKRMAWIAPILGNTNPGYLRNRPTAWSNGFVVIEVRKDGRFNLYPVIVCNGEFSFAGEDFKG